VPVISFDVPVFRDNEVKYALSVGVFPQRMAELLIRQKLPSNWIAAVLDTSGVIVARTHNAERFAGQKAAPLLLQAMTRELSGVVETKTVRHSGLQRLQPFGHIELDRHHRYSRRGIVS
jgi:hypothetical protein